MSTPVQSFFPLLPEGKPPLSLPSKSEWGGSERQCRLELAIFQNQLAPSGKRSAYRLLSCLLCSLFLCSRLCRFFHDSSHADASLIALHKRSIRLQMNHPREDIVPSIGILWWGILARTACHAYREMRSLNTYKHFILILSIMGSLYGIICRRRENACFLLYFRVFSEKKFKIILINFDLYFVIMLYKIWCISYAKFPLLRIVEIVEMSFHIRYL